jgi:glycosyltransferase involved in cell wall biosynthesis
MGATRYKPKSLIKHLYYQVLASFDLLRETMSPPKEISYLDIPVIINNFNRVVTLKKLIESLEKRGYFNIYIIDNKSTYPPLLEYYKTCRYKVFMLDRNIGTLALWKSGIIRQFESNFFVYTDSDVVPVDECPDDFMKFFLEVLKRHKLARKVGFSLKIDDIPDTNLIKEYIHSTQEPFYHYYNEAENLYRAPIGATFALYRPRGKYNHANFHIEIYRTGFPYQALHLPWYEDTGNLSAEEKYYLDSIGDRTDYSKNTRRRIDDIERLKPGK